MTTSTELAWFAGFIDGEGSISIVKSYDPRRGTAGYRPCLQFSQVDGAVVRHVESLFRGRSTHQPHKNPNARPQWHWQVRGTQDVLLLLEGLLPYLRLKHEQAAWVIQWCRNRLSAPGSRPPYTQVDDFIYERLRGLNARGVQA